MSHLNDFRDKIYDLEKVETVESNISGSQRKYNLRRVITISLIAGLIILFGGGALFIDTPMERAEQMLSQGTSANSSQILTDSIAFGTLGVNVVEATNTPADLAQAFREAEASFARKAWAEAIAYYTEIRAIDDTYEAELISKHLATAYREAALELIKNGPENDGDLETSRRYLREASALDQTDIVAQEEYALLTSYLAGVRSLGLQEPGEALELLLDVYETRPDYLNGLAAQQLYNAYVALGDLAFRRGETDVARDVYNLAVALGLDGLNAASIRLASMDELVKLTPTPYPANLATVQASAADRGLLPVLLPTPTPASLAEATKRAEYATAVAVTTGTFTPEPAAYVTPILVFPSPPAESVATEVARAVEATARASAILVPTNTPMPYNAVMGEYVYATPVPGNAATAEAQAVIDEANLILYGSPTPLPWNAIMITPVPPTPTPLPTLPPTSTPVPLLVPVSDLTATPSPQPTAVAPDTFPPELRNKIVFLSDRGGVEQTYLLDPVTGEVSLVTQGWVYPLAQEQLGFSPDGNREAIVLADNNRILQIQIRDHKYNTTRQVTAVNRTQNASAMAYDPAWSPVGDTIAYVSSETTGDEIYTINIADGSDGSPHRLTNNAWEWDKHPTWSPDGSQIVFYSNRETGRTQLWIMNADGSDPRNLSNNEYNDWNPVWIP